MKKLFEIIEEFSDMGDRVAFSIKNGTHYEGYILEVFETQIELILGGPMASDEPLILDIAEIDLDTLSFFCPEDRVRINAVWCFDSQVWKIKRIERP